MLKTGSVEPHWRGLKQDEKRGRLGCRKARLLVVCLRELVINNKGGEECGAYGDNKNSHRMPAWMVAYFVNLKSKAALRQSSPQVQTAASSKESPVVLWDSAEPSRQSSPDTLRDFDVDAINRDAFEVLGDFEAESSTQAPTSKGSTSIQW